MKAVKKLLLGLAAAVGISTAAVAATTTYTWQKWCEDTSYTSTSLSGTGNELRVNQSKKYVFKANLDATDMLGAKLWTWDGDANKITLSCTEEGNAYLEFYRKTSGDYKTATSTEVVTAGEHQFSILVNRGPGGGGHDAYVCVHIDGEELVKVSGFNFDTNPMRNTYMGDANKSGNTFTAYHEAQTGNVSDFDAAMANIDADAKILFPAYVTYTATVSDSMAWSEIEWNEEIDDPSVADLVLTVENSATIALDGTYSYHSVSVNGDVVFEMPEDMFESGCWKKTLLACKFTAEGTVTFADLADGFNGAYEQTANGITLRAQNKEVISINIGGGQGTDDASPDNYLVPDNDTYYGLAPVKGSTWNNISGRWQTGWKTITLKGSIASDANGGKVPRPTIDLSASAKNTWSYDCTDPFLSGYLDDGSGVEVAVHGVPYTKYDVIVYATSDSSRLIQAITVNGTTYTYKDGETVEGNDGWGVGKAKTAEFGKNALYIKDLEGEELSITCASVQGGTSYPRGTLCAVQVICQGEVVISSEYYGEISGDVAWTDGESENLVQTSGDAWVNSELSMLTLTNVADAATLSFETETQGLFFKLVSEADKAVTIPAGSFADNNLSFSMVNFTDAAGKVIIDVEGMEEEQTIFASDISGYENIEFANVPDGFAAYADAKGIYIATTIDSERTSPTTDDTETFRYVFLGTEDGDWANKANWRIVDDNGAARAFTDTYYPQSPGGNGKAWQAALFDGELIGEGAISISCEKVEGWNTKLGFYNGVSVEIDHMNKFANYYMWIDESSSVSIGSVSGSAFQYGYVFNVAGTLTIGQVTGASIPYTYNLGENAVVTYTDGVQSGTHAINGGKLIAEGDGIAAAVTITNEVTIVTPALAARVTISPESTLTLESTAEDELVLAKLTNDGTLNVAAGTVVILPGTRMGTITTSGDGKVIEGVTVNINDMGRYKIPEGKTAEDIRLFDESGTEVEVTGSDESYVYFDWKYTGGACLWDYEFNEGSGQTPKNSGSNTAALNLDGDRSQAMKDRGEYATNIVETAQGTVTNIALRVPNRPWRDVSSWPTEATFMFYGKMVGTDKAYQIAFGSKNGTNNNQLFFATKSVADGTVDLCYSVAGATPTILCTMNVPNAQASDHLYAVVLKDDGEGNSVVNTYLDGKLLQPYTHTGTLTLGKGFQIASGHGGVAMGYNRPADDDPATMDWLRVYDVELSSAVMARMAEIYKYVSENGEATRTVAAGDDTAWVEDDKWTQVPFEGEAVITNAPNADTVVKLTVADNVTLALNLDSNANYEALEIRGDGALTLTGAEDAVVPSVSGTTTIGTDVTVAYDAIKFANVNIDDGKTLTFDFTTLDLSKEFANRSIKLTGVAILGEDSSVAIENVSEVTGRSAALVYDSHTQQYALQITVEELPFVYTVAGWTWADAAVTPEVVSNNTAVGIISQADLLWTVDRNGITVEAGTFTIDAVTKRAAAVTVEEGAVLDLNGNNVQEMALTLNGGKVTNSGVAPEEADQIKTLTLTADSVIDTPVKGQIYAASYGTVTTIELGDGFTLTKTGEAMLQVVNTDITGTGTVYVAEGEFYGSEDTRVSEDVTFKVGKDATLHNRLGKTMSATKITGEGGVLKNEGTMPGFELSGTLTIANAGTFGTITNAVDAVVNLGEKRGLVFAGGGTNNVTLTAAEYENGSATIFTLADEATTVIGTVTYDGEDITDKCTIVGGSITAITKEEPVEPVVPGEGIEIPSGATVEEFVQTVNDNKATLLTAPEGVLEGEALTAYQALFTAELDGEVVRFVLNADGIAAVEAATTVAKTTALEAALGTDTTLTIDEPLAGFYYSFKQGGELANLGFKATGDQNKLGGKDTIEFALVKPENAGFYQMIITPAPYAE